MKYCPHCKTARATLQLVNQGDEEDRCASCGFRFADAPGLEQPIPAQGDRVLCIDDDPLVRQLLTMILEKSGFVPFTAPDGPTGLQVAATERPELIVVDLMMPGLDGYEVCRCLRSNPQTAKVPLVILTANRDPKLNVKAFQAGADLALTKPFDPDKLMAALRAALAMKSTQLAL